MKRLECLDGLRGVLAVYVMLGHMAPFAALPPWLIAPLEHGGAAVDVFFILSGMVIFRSLESCQFRAGPFLILRTTRTFPVYLTMLAAAIVLQPLPAPFAAMPWIAPAGLAHDILPQGWRWPAVLGCRDRGPSDHDPRPVSRCPTARCLEQLSGRRLEPVHRVAVLRPGPAARAHPHEPRTTGDEVFLLLAAAGLAWDVAAPEAWRFSRAFLPDKAQYFALGDRQRSIDELTVGRRDRLHSSSAPPCSSAQRTATWASWLRR